MKPRHGFLDGEPTRGEVFLTIALSILATLVGACVLLAYLTSPTP